MCPSEAKYNISEIVVSHVSKRGKHGAPGVFQLGWVTVGRVEPCVVETGEFAGGIGYCLDSRVVGLGRFSAGRPRERECIEGGLWGITKAALERPELSALSQGKTSWISE